MRLKVSELEEIIKEEIVMILSEQDVDKEEMEASTIATKAYKKSVDDLTTSLEKLKNTEKLEEDDEDYEGPSQKQVKGGDSVANIANKLGETKREMKQVVKKWKSTEGAKKESYLNRLKELTSIKKELENILDNPSTTQDEEF